jgi:formylglycine-generating enzyme required for sulfatase activity
MTAAPKGMLYIPGGPFSMGSPPDAGYPDESPVHSVCVIGFYIDKHEVTNAQFKEFVEAIGYITDAEKNGSPDVPTWRHPYGPESDAEQMPNYPVVCVSWNDANAYALWTGKRLPTEAEWEKAARGTDGRMYPWGNTAPAAASANIADKSGAFKWSDAVLDDTYKTASPVGSFPGGRSVYGVEDMAGNVWEWCFDWWNKDYYRASPSQNPAGPDTGEFKVIRGGSWFYSADGARTTHRMYFRPTGNGAAIGFRCVKDVG